MYYAGDTEAKPALRCSTAWIAWAKSTEKNNPDYELLVVRLRIKTQNLVTADSMTYLVSTEKQRFRCNRMRVSD